MKSIAIFRDTSPLAREVWTFWFDSRDATLCLDMYVAETRPSTRHRKWTKKAKWSRIFDRDNTIKIPPSPADVEQEALETFRSYVIIKPRSPR